MTTDRPYRKRLSLETVIEELEKCKGTQFDPAIIDVVIDSVTIRGVIAAQSNPDKALEAGPLRSKRVNWPTSGLWKRRA